MVEFEQRRTRNTVQLEVKRDLIDFSPANLNLDMRGSITILDRGLRSRFMADRNTMDLSPYIRMSISVISRWYEIETNDRSELDHNSMNQNVADLIP